MIGMKRSVSKLVGVPCKMQAIRSKPAPVSMFLLGSSLYSLADAIDGVKLAEDDAPNLDVAVVFDIIGQKFDAEMLRVPLLAAVKKTSVFGPHGPSPICQ
jgi:hypothetical protein